MFRTPLLSIKSSIARGQKFLSTTTAAAPEGYAVPVKIFHWTMGISMLACVGKQQAFLFLNDIFSVS